MIAKYLIQLRQSKLCRKGCCQPPYDVTPLETAMPLGVKGRRSYPLLRLGSYKPMAFRPWVVDHALQFSGLLPSPLGYCPILITIFCSVLSKSPAFALISSTFSPVFVLSPICGRGGGIRTHEYQLQRPGPSPLGYTPVWSWWTDSNPRPADYKSAALPTELRQHMERPTGLEPATPRLEVWCSTS